MRPLRVSLSLLAASILFTTTRAVASIESPYGVEGLRLTNAEMVSELWQGQQKSKIQPSGPDYTFVGFTSGHQNDQNNYWSIYAGTSLNGFHQFPSPNGTWTWTDPVKGDALQGWWPIRNVYTSTGQQTLSDCTRPWWAIDIGNNANYVINEAGSAGLRTFGVDGVWHRDGGNTVAQPAGSDGTLPPPPSWSPLQGSFSAWMGLRAHGDRTSVNSNPNDLSNVDPHTGNPFNEDVLSTNGMNGNSESGNDKAFPGYGSQMDQMLYRDIPVTPGAPLTICFSYRTEMSTEYLSDPAVRTGWFEGDPLEVVSCEPSDGGRNDYIFASAPAAPPVDRFSVYVGVGVGNSEQWQGSDGTLHPTALEQAAQGHPGVNDPRHRWFSEVLKWDRDPNSPPLDQQPKYYAQLMAVTGVNLSQNVCYTIPVATLTAWGSPTTVRLVFRVKTNRGFDDEGLSYSSQGRGAAVVDAVTYQFGAGPIVNFGDFENASSINNDPAVPATSAWKSTGKPPAIYHHVRSHDQLIYEDLCGQPGDPTRICNMAGNVISAGDLNASEAAGGLVDRTAERERADGILSPVINLAGPYDGSGLNPMGVLDRASPIHAGNALADDDYYIDFEVYTGIMDPLTKGNLWRYGAQCFPARSKLAWNGTRYPAWGQLRFSDFVDFDADQQCFRDLEPLGRAGLIRTSNPDGIPDSIRIYLGKVQECFRFGVSTGCSPTDGCYWDNVSFVISDAVLSANSVDLSADIWNWLQDAFPADETVPPGTGCSQFGSLPALVKTGLNIAPATGNPSRCDQSGDTIVVNTAQWVARVDMIFRVLPGPGNYSVCGDGTSAIKKSPSSTAIAVFNGNTFFEQYLTHPGTFATGFGQPGGVAGSNGAVLKHAVANGTAAHWDPNTWNSARCDTAEMNLFACQGKGILGGPPDVCRWMATYHESDPHFSVLGVVHNRCFVRCKTCDVSDVICTGAVPTDDMIGGYLPVGTAGTTREGTKIIPDDLLTCGSHVEYFFRTTYSEGDTLASSFFGMMPDTFRVSPQTGEGSTDGHRWEEFSVLPDCWKGATFRHPIYKTLGRGPACLLVVDNNDRRGDERAMISVLDTLGATEYRKLGAHNGWHAVGANPPAVDPVGTAVDINNPANHRNPAGPSASTQRVGFVAEHGGQPGTTWDLYQVKASESLTTLAGSLGSRLSFQGPACSGLRSLQGPTSEMLDTYYPLVLFLSGDLNEGILGPYRNRSADDAHMIRDYLGRGDPSVQTRGLWVMGDGFVESEEVDGGDHAGLLADLGSEKVLDSDYTRFSGNTDNLAALRSYGAFQGKGADIFYGIRNECYWTNDVPELTDPVLAVVAASYARNVTLDHVATASIFKTYGGSQSPFKSLLDGWDIEHLTTYLDRNTIGRSAYFLKIFSNVWSKLCIGGGSPIFPVDVPGPDGQTTSEFLQLFNNPMRSGLATVRFGLTKADRVEGRIFDVSGRQVRLLADRMFPAGEHTLTWDGLDDERRPVPRGVYFTRLRYRVSGFHDVKKLTLLR